MNDDELAEILAVSAGRVLLALRDSGLLTGKELGAAGDAVAHAWLTRALRSVRPDDGLLSEEEAADSERLQHRRIWIVDPLDGTREYSDDREDWAVHVALVVGGYPTASAVSLPAQDVVFSTARPITVPPTTEPVRIAVSRTRPPAFAEGVAESLGAELVPMGSAGYKTMAVVRGEVDAYLHDGGQYEWDSAAPVGVAVHAGLHASRLDGSPLEFGQADPWSPELLVSRPELVQRLVTAIAEVGRA